MSKSAVKPSSGNTRNSGAAPASSRARNRLPELHTRMRARRSQLGLTGAELAQRAGVSPSYVSLIEKGVKVPDEDVAAGLARALEDDESLYRAWARAARLGLHDLALLNRLEVIARTPAYASLVESGQELPMLDRSALDRSALEPPRAVAADLAARMREVASRIEPPAAAGSLVSEQTSTVQVPVLAEGADPGESRPVRDRLILDRRLLGEGEPAGLFAYEVAGDAMKHLRGVAAPGDTVIFGRDAAVAPDRICAVRTGHGVALARVLFKDRWLLLLPGEGESDFEAVEVPDPKAMSEVVAGAHVLLIRR